MPYYYRLPPEPRDRQAYAIASTYRRPVFVNGNINDASPKCLWHTLDKLFEERGWLT